jgi:hypothetical protein
MRAVDVALNSRLAADLGTAGTLGVLGCTGVYRFQAPQGSVEPYVVFQQQAGTDSYSFSARDGRSLVYLVKAVDVGPSGLRAAQMAERIDALLTDKPLSLTGWTQLRLRRESDVEYVEVDAGKTYQHYGALFRVDVRQ